MGWTGTVSGFCEYGNEHADFLTKVIMLMVAARIYCRYKIVRKFCC